MPKQITKYLCEHCYKHSYVSKSACKKHEARCIKNPANKTCATCMNDSIGCEYRGDTAWGTDGNDQGKFKIMCLMWENKEVCHEEI